MYHCLVVLYCCAPLCCLQAVIPPNTTVLLDVSTPILAGVVVQGTLKFDETQPNLHLQVGTPRGVA